MKLNESKKEKELAIVFKLEIVVLLPHFPIEKSIIMSSNDAIHLFLINALNSHLHLLLCFIMSHDKSVFANYSIMVLRCYFIVMLRPAPNGDGRPQPGPVRVRAEFLSIGCIKSQSK